MSPSDVVAAAAAQSLAKLIAAFPESRLAFTLSNANIYHAHRYCRVNHACCFSMCRLQMNLEASVPPLCKMLASANQDAAEAAAWLLGYLSADQVNKLRVVELGGAVPLIEALMSAGPRAREGAAWALSGLATETSNVATLVHAHAIPRGLKMLETGESCVSICIVRCRSDSSLTNTARGAGKPFGRDCVLQMLACIGREGDGAHVGLIGLGGAKRVARILASRPPVEAAVPVVRALCSQRGALNASFAVRRNLSLYYLNFARSTTNEHAMVSSFSQWQQTAVVEAGVVRPLLHLVKHGSDAGRIAATWAVAELSPLDVARKAMLADRAVSRLVQTLNSGALTAKEAAAVALYHLCVGAEVQVELVKLHGLMGLNQLLLTGGGAAAKTAAVRVVGALAGCLDFQRHPARPGLLVNVAQLLGADRPLLRIAAADALFRQGTSNATNWVLVQKGVPLLVDMLDSFNMAEVDVAVGCFATFCCDIIVCCP